MLRLAEASGCGLQRGLRLFGLRLLLPDSDAIDATRNNRYSVAPLLTLTLRMTVIQTLSIKESKAG